MQYFLLKYSSTEPIIDTVGPANCQGSRRYNTVLGNPPPVD